MAHLLPVGTLVTIVDRDSMPPKEFVGIINSLTGDDRYMVTKFNHTLPTRGGEVIEKINHPVRLDVGSQQVGEQYFIKEVRREINEGELVSKLAAEVERLRAEVKALEVVAKSALAGIETINHPSLVGDEMSAMVRNAIQTGQKVMVVIPGIATPGVAMAEPEVPAPAAEAPAAAPAPAPVATAAPSPTPAAKPAKK